MPLPGGRPTRGGLAACVTAADPVSVATYGALWVAQHIILDRALFARRPGHGAGPAPVERELEQAKVVIVAR